MPLPVPPAFVAPNRSMRSMFSLRELGALNLDSTPATEAFWERVYCGATFPNGRCVIHEMYAITPNTMRPDDWELLSSYFGVDMIARYYAGATPPKRARYKRHYEIEPLPLP